MIFLAASCSLHTVIQFTCRVSTTRILSNSSRHIYVEIYTHHESSLICQTTRWVHTVPCGVQEQQTKEKLDVSFTIHLFLKLNLFHPLIAMVLIYPPQNIHSRTFGRHSARIFVFLGPNPTDDAAVDANHCNNWSVYQKDVDIDIYLDVQRRRHKLPGKRTNRKSTVKPL
jgi:hypothetical protein